MTFNKLIFTILILTLLGCDTDKTINYKADLIIKGGTIINLTNHGKVNHDQKNKAILIKADTIFDIVDISTIAKDQKNLLDATDKFIIPGLTDGFSVINNQSYANAFLYMGITDVIGVESERRGEFYHNASPSPNIHMLQDVGEEPISDEEVIQTIENHAKNKVEILLIMYGLNPNQVQLAHNKAKEFGMGTIGELGFTNYKEGMDMGIDAFVHTTRYSLDVAPDTLAKKVAEQPFSNDLGSPKWRYYKLLTELTADNPNLLIHAKNIGASKSFIQPTFALLYLDMPFSKNPWKEKVAQIIDINDINRPADKVSGKHNYPKEELDAYKKLANQQLLIEKIYYQNGAKYLSGSATDVWGSMPGISLHQELEVLHKIGLSNREVIASSTSNFNAAYGLKFGKIKKGFKANILILDKNPIENLEYLKGQKRLILNGVEIDLEKLLVKN
ncbi:MAG: amidohydrolase family protein [Flavobacteriaceae bacterium]|nr:amidohydrolase family protein [Flavobacteriaceae bacterium]